MPFCVCAPRAASVADRATRTPPSPLVLSYASGFSRLPGPPALSSDRLAQTLHTQTVGHSPRAKGKARLEGGGQAGRTVPARPR